MRNTISLCDDKWLVGPVEQKPFSSVFDLAEVKDWLPARVPGDVRLDLLRAGKIPDPYCGIDNEASQWIDLKDWWYVRDIQLDDSSDLRSHLMFEGIDYLSAVFWNGAELGRHTGMFSHQIYELPRPWTGQLAVRVWGGGALPRIKTNSVQTIAKRVSPLMFPDRIATLKCQMSFGWDFAPKLLTCGIWDDANIVQGRLVFIRDLWLQSVPDGRVRVMALIDSTEDRPISAEISVRGRNFSSDVQHYEFELEASAGVNHFDLQFRIEEPSVWSPWDRGEPNLYELELLLCDEAGDLDSASATFGLRTIDLEPNPGAPAAEPPWTFVVNGHPEFIRGANWAPADSIPARVTRQDYSTLLHLAREANINLLRVWGGGLREKRAFYDLCDELGILVWQEFPFSGAPLDHLERDSNLLNLARAECGAIVRGLRNHPSLALWCGGNEFNTLANAPLVDSLRETVARFDGTRPFKPASPSVGEHHNWRVWHAFANTRDYRQDDAGFYGEFGLQSAPSVNTLEKFLRPGQVWPPRAAWAYHKAELTKLWRYARSVQPRINSAEAFVSASQMAQLRGLQVMIEHARRAKGRAAGCAVWQFNEPWPAISWSLVQYDRGLKRAYVKLQELYNPVLVSFYYPLGMRRAGDRVAGELWLINDSLRPLQGTIRAYLDDLQVFSLEAKIAANRAEQVGGLQVVHGAGRNELRLEFLVDGRIASTNEYDLNYFDHGEIGWLRARLSDRADLFKS